MKTIQQKGAVLCRLLKVTAAAAILSLTVSTVIFAEAGDNLCYPHGALADASGWINEEERAACAIDGDVDTKWCAGLSDVKRSRENSELSNLGYCHWIVVDFGQSCYFDRYSLLHASLGARDYGQLQYNALAWTVQITDRYDPDSSSDSVWETISIAEFDAPSLDNERTDVYTGIRKARFVRLLISVPESGGTTVRLPEFMVFACDEGELASGIVRGIGTVPDTAENENDEIVIEGYHLQDGNFSVTEEVTSPTLKHVVIASLLALAAAGTAVLAGYKTMKNK